MRFSAHPILVVGFALGVVAAGCRGPQATAPQPATAVPPADLLGQGREQFRAGQYDAAEALFAQALQRQPDLLAARYYVGRCEYQKGAYDKAASAFSEVASKHPKSADAWAWLGQSYEALKRPQDALTAYKQSRTLDPKSEIARKALARLGPAKRIAVTIDDGPSLTYSIKAMDECEKYGGRLTFFVEGTYCQREPQIIKLMQKRGHQIGNHSWDHANLAKLPEDKVRYQLGHTNDTIVQQGGAKPTYMRPPFGARNELVDRICAELGLKVVFWDVDTSDWEASRSGAQTVEYVLSHARPDAVVLMHQVHNTYTVLGQVFAGLDKAGYTCVRLDELPRYPQKMGT
jgi:peptidoglycan/xylan/chitin deacetylase (PgdA/CDA1 family)